MARKKVIEVVEEEVDAMDVVNDLSLAEFVERYVMDGYVPQHASEQKRPGSSNYSRASRNISGSIYPPCWWSSRNEWKSWIHIKSESPYTITLQTSTQLSKIKTAFEACFKLIESTSSVDYKKSKDGWKPRSKRKEMALLDLKYFLLKNKEGVIEGFCSFMPTYEDGIAVIYLYEIHLGKVLQG